MSVTVGNNNVVIENNFFRREIAVNQNGLHTVSIFSKVSGREYVRRPDAAEFQLTLNDTVIVSYSKPEVHIVDGNVREHEHFLKLEDIKTEKNSSGSETVRISFLCSAFSARIKSCYEIHPDLPGASKWLEIEALGNELHLHQIFFEMLNTCPGNFSDSVILKHGLVKAQPCFTASGDEDILQVHDSALKAGLFVGSGAPGPLRYYMVYPNWPSGIACGYNMASADFNKFLKKDELFITDRTYVCLYEGDINNTKAFNTFREMIRRDLPACTDNGGAMYCTWLPFLKNINEKLLLELADRAAAMGFTWFVVDDGWFSDNNWEIDRSKFPNGLKPVSDKVRKAGMKFGLWFNIGTDYGQVGSRPEDNALDYHGNPKTFGPGAKTTVRCFASEQRTLMAEKLISLAEEYSVDYFKLDFSNICSPYGIMTFGCTSTAHKHHRDFSDSVTEQYNSLMYMRNEIKKRFKDLVIDFSFESFGTEFPSIGALHYSELHHSSNMNTLQPDVLKADKIRNALYQYCNLLPNERILGSLICLQNSRDVEHILTALVTTPLAAGDLRAIDPATISTIKTILTSMKTLTANGPLTEFQLLDNTAQPWDAYARYTKDGNGIICVFRNNFTGDKLKITLDDIPDGNYTLCNILNASEPLKYSAEQLRAGIDTAFPAASSCMAFILRKN